MLAASFTLTAYADDKTPSRTATAVSPKPAVVREQAERSVSTRQQTQKQVDSFASRESDFLDNIEQLEQELKLLTRQREKTEAYLNGQLTKVAELKRKIAEMERIRAELEPLLDHAAADLKDSVTKDLPFLLAERETRLASLDQDLNDYDASLADKTRRLLECLAVEARYGSTVDVEETEVKIGDTLQRLRVFRLGRIGIFALSADGRQAWRYDPGQKAYLAIDGHVRGLDRAADIADRQRVVSLVELPVGQPAGGEVKP